MNFSVARGSASLGSRSRLLTGRSRSARQLIESETLRVERPARRPSKGTTPRSVKEELFRKEVWGYWKEHGRHNLPWRLPSLKLRQGKKDFDPYRVLVSEVMLQQTQVSRVSEKYREFLEVFPTVRTLARASLLDVLKMWSGLGYNRRAKYLHDAAKIIIGNRKGRFPMSYEELRELPGVGDYTAKAVRVFAFNKPEILIETNIRTAFIHYFYSSVLPARRGLLARRSFSGVGGAGGQKTAIADVDILPVALKVGKRQDPREWYWALMDYGAYLKGSGVHNNHRSKHYTRQSKFKGSLRQVRGAILRVLTTRGNINDLHGRYKNKYNLALASLARDGLVPKGYIK